MYTYRDLIRKYADDVRRGTAGTDLTPRQRKLCALILATGSNDPFASVAYPPTDDGREQIIRRLLDSLWNANVSTFMDTLGPTIRADYGIAAERAVTILRGI